MSLGCHCNLDRIALYSKPQPCLKMSEIAFYFWLEAMKAKDVILETEMFLLNGCRSLTPGSLKFDLYVI